MGTGGGALDADAAALDPVGVLRGVALPHDVALGRHLDRLDALGESDEPVGSEVSEILAACQALGDAQEGEV